MSSFEPFLFYFCFGATVFYALATVLLARKRLEIDHGEYNFFMGMEMTFLLLALLATVISLTFWLHGWARFATVVIGAFLLFFGWCIIISKLENNH